MELLAPAGDFACLQAALEAGADAVAVILDHVPFTDEQLSALESRCGGAPRLKAVIQAARAALRRYEAKAPMLRTLLSRRVAHGHAGRARIDEADATARGFHLLLSDERTGEPGGKAQAWRLMNTSMGAVVPFLAGGTRGRTRRPTRR